MFRWFRARWILARRACFKSDLIYWPDKYHLFDSTNWSSSISNSRWLNKRVFVLSYFTQMECIFRSKWFNHIIRNHAHNKEKKLSIVLNMHSKGKTSCTLEVAYDWSCLLCNAALSEPLSAITNCEYFRALIPLLIKKTENLVPVCICKKMNEFHFANPTR